MLVNNFLEQSAKLFLKKTALICQDKRLSYAEIDALANRLSNALIANGLDRQDRVAVYLDNSVESVISIFGVMKAGGVFVVVNPQVKAKKIEYILNNCQVKVLITDSKHLKEISEILPHCPNLNTILIIDYKHDTQYAMRPKEVLSAVEGRNMNLSANPLPIIAGFYDILNSYPSTQPPKRCIDIDLASMIYTSGSTGNPKGVMLTHLNMTSAANSIIEYLENRPDDIILNCLPLSFDYGLYQVLMAFKFGGTIVLERGFTYPFQIINLLVKERITGFPLVPAIAAILLQLTNLDKYDFSKLRYITNTAQAFPPKHIARFRGLFPQVKIYSMYGLTECKRVTYLPPAEVDKRPSSVGKAMPNTEVYLVDEGGCIITQPGQAGELVIRGANVMKGYWNLPELTVQRLRPGPYGNEKVLYSGDYFKMDEEGFLYFISRKDDIIKTAGEMVSPKEVENILYELDDVIEAAVVGVPDDILGNAIRAFLVLREGSQLTEKEILLHCQKHLENFMVPKYVEFRKELPKTTTGKIKKRALV